MTDTPLRRLARLIEQHGPVPAARLSSAKAHGRAAQYSYWGVALYEIRLNRRQRLIAVAVSPAKSERRSIALAERDLLDMCAGDDRFPLSKIGEIDDAIAAAVLKVMRPVHRHWFRADSQREAEERFAREVVVPRLNGTERS